MTFKKINKTSQAIFEYIILTTAVLAVILFFRDSSFFRRQPADPPTARGAREITKEAVDLGVATMGFENGNRLIALP